MTSRLACLEAKKKKKSGTSTTGLASFWQETGWKFLISASSDAGVSF
jgi:hypothetical protein